MSSDPNRQHAANGILSSTGQARFSGIEAEILLGGDAAPFTVMDMTVVPGLGAPAHISFQEDKVFHVTEGVFLFLVGEDRVQAEPGDHILVAKGVTHSFSALGDSPAKMTLISTPAKHERFFLALSGLPVPHDPGDVEAACQKHDQAIVGPVVQP
jgi:quercetin dioxygenase-like cupin family protein